MNDDSDLESTYIFLEFVIVLCVLCNLNVC